MTRKDNEFILAEHYAKEFKIDTPTFLAVWETCFVKTPLKGNKDTTWEQYMNMLFAQVKKSTTLQHAMRCSDWARISGIFFGDYLNRKNKDGKIIPYHKFLFDAYRRFLRIERGEDLEYKPYVPKEVKVPDGWKPERMNGYFDPRGKQLYDLSKMSDTPIEFTDEQIVILYPYRNEINSHLFGELTEDKLNTLKADKELYRLFKEVFPTSKYSIDEVKEWMYCIAASYQFTENKLRRRHSSPKKVYNATINKLLK